MFGNRKRKPKDEDDPLVPHGLIWYASESAPHEESKPAEPSKQSSEIVETNRPRPAESIQQQVESSQDNAPNSPASPDTQKREPAVAPRPIDRSSSAPSRDPITTTPPRKVVELSPKTAQKLRVAEVIDISNPIPADRDTISTLSRCFLRLRTSTTTALGTALSIGQTLRREGMRTWKSAQLKQQSLRLREVSTQLLNNGAGLARRYRQTMQNTLPGATQAGKQQQQHLFGKAKSVLEAGTTRVSGFLGKGGHKSKRIRIVLTGLPLRLKILLARRFSEWEMMQAGPADARLRSSMTLAAIFAIIALIIVSVVPRYAAKSLPSRMFNSTSTVNASTAAPAPTAVTLSKPVSKNGAAGKKIARVTRPLTPVHKPVLAIKKTPQRKVYRTAEDDYIAPDTYTYYGDKSSVPR